MDIHTSDLTVTFPDHRGPSPQDRAVVNALNLTISTGEHVALVGPSGAGKSTLLRALLGAVPATGTVRVGGRDPFRSRREARAIRSATGFLRQGNDLVLGVSARLNAAVGTAARWGLRSWLAVATGGVPAPDASRLAALAAEHGITELLPARARDLSGGERQRVALVRAMLSAPGLLLADEPTTGLDPAAATVAVDALCGVPEGTTVIVATHDPTVARRFARTIAIRAGNLVHDGPALDRDAAAAVYGTGSRVSDGDGSEGEG